MVGVRGFEPPTPASRTQYSTRLSYTPIGSEISIRQRLAGSADEDGADADVASERQNVRVTAKSANCNRYSR